MLQRHELRWRLLKVLMVVLCGVVGTEVVRRFSVIYREQSFNRRPDFKGFQEKYGKMYSSEEEQAYREFMYYRQLERIAKHNAADGSYRMGVNQFSDLSEQEFSELYLTVKAIGREKGFLRKVEVDNEIEEEYQSTPEEASDYRQDVNWTSLFPPVKDQYRCASCYSFPVTALTEALYAKKDGIVRSFSEQELIDCASEAYKGCINGSIIKGFNYIIKNGIHLDSEYEYTSKDGTSKLCGIAPSNKFKVSKLVPIKRGYCPDILRVLVRQPVVAMVDSSNWGSYEQGIFDNCGTVPNHGVVIVGRTKEYWLVRNSWGKSWGEYGYIRLAPGNTCGLCESASFPMLE